MCLCSFYADGLLQLQCAEHRRCVGHECVCGVGFEFQKAKGQPACPPFLELGPVFRMLSPVQVWPETGQKHLLRAMQTASVLGLVGAAKAGIPGGA